MFISCLCVKTNTQYNFVMYYENYYITRFVYLEVISSARLPTFAEYVHTSYIHVICCFGDHEALSCLELNTVKLTSRYGDADYNGSGL